MTAYVEDVFATEIADATDKTEKRAGPYTDFWVFSDLRDLNAGKSHRRPLYAELCRYYS